MSKVLPASCNAHIVTIENVPVSPVTVLSQGTAPSTGIAILDKDKATYLTSNATDLKTAITTINNLITQIIAIVTALDGVTLSPGTTTALTALLTTANATFLTSGDLLK